MESIRRLSCDRMLRLSSTSAEHKNFLTTNVPRPYNPHLSHFPSRLKLFLRITTRLARRCLQPIEPTIHPHHSTHLTTHNLAPILTRILKRNRHFYAGLLPLWLAFSHPPRYPPYNSLDLEHSTLAPYRRTHSPHPDQVSLLAPEHSESSTDTMRA